ncbi:MAG TPA: TolC family protein [Phycisphaerae bacterium]|nr:TolC family protein [Phycisphaerae bacterium]HRY66816.1 TolC family protein [Phycisphaerae bacterium]HSA26874.1 TolC family protein [Phycisphaerae bacterium]
MKHGVQEGGCGVFVPAAKYLGAACSVAMVLCCFGCSQVDPKPDYARAGDLIKASAGQDGVYSPAEPGLTEEEIQAFLAEGLGQEEAVRIALLNNRELQAAFYDIGVARADWVQSGLLANPTISTALRFPSGGGSTDILGAFSQNIADIWQIPIRKKVAEGLVEQAVLRVAGVGSSVAGNVRRAYQDAVTAEDRADLASRNAQQANASVAVVRGRRSPAASPLDVDMVRGDAMQAELAAQEATSEVAVRRHQLAKLLSLATLPDHVRLTDRLRDAGSVPLPTDKAIAVARVKRVDLQAASKAEAATQAQIKAEYAKVIPAFNLGMDMEREPQIEETSKSRLATIRDTVRTNVRSRVLSSITGGAGAALPLGGLTATAEPEEEAALGPLLAVTLPIFDQNLAQVSKAKLLHEQAVKQRELLETNVGHDIAMQHDRAELASRNLAFYRDKLLPQAELNLRGAEADYQAGKTPAVTLLDAQRTLFDVRHQHLQARGNATTAIGDLEQAVGAPLAVAATMPAAELAPPTAPGKAASALSVPIPNALPATPVGQSLTGVPAPPAASVSPGMPALKTPALPAVPAPPGGLPALKSPPLPAAPALPGPSPAQKTQELEGAVFKVIPPINAQKK